MKARERWSGLCLKIPQQAKIESANNCKLSKATADFDDSTG